MFPEFSYTCLRQILCQRIERHNYLVVKIVSHLHLRITAFFVVAGNGCEKAYYVHISFDELSLFSSDVFRTTDPVRLYS